MFRLILFGLFACNLLLLSACRVAPAPRATDDASLSPVVPDPTQNRTQTPSGIVRTLRPTVSSSPLVTTSPIPRNTTFACPGAPPTRLIVQERGMVTRNNQRLNLRAGPGTDYDILTSLQPGTLFMVLDGPDCVENYTWFRVRYAQQFGWIAEGDADFYYAEPFFPG